LAGPAPLFARLACASLSPQLRQEARDPSAVVVVLLAEAVPAISNLYEMRIWLDGAARPAAPLVSIVPEPSTATLLGAGLLALGMRRRSRAA
jgi:hypothetical protein